MNVRYRKSFDRDIRRVNDGKLLARLHEIINRVKTAESLREVPDVRKMAGKHGYYRIRLGEYRIGIQLENQNVWFVRFLPRKSIYRDFP